MSNTGFGMEPIQEGKQITVERWLKRMWLDPVGRRKTKPRRALTVVQKKQGVAALIVKKKDDWDCLTRIESKEGEEKLPYGEEGQFIYYRRVKDLSTLVTPGKDRVVVVPADLWNKMTKTNLFIGQFKKDEGKDELAEGLSGQAHPRSPSS